MPRLAIALLLATSVSAKKPVAQPSVEPPLRVVAAYQGERLANCIFAKQPIPPHAGYATPLASAFSDGDPMFARCYFPEHLGSNKPGELTDVLFLDGKKWWTQAYDQAVPSDAMERPVVLTEILRSIRGSIPPGNHLVEMVGHLRRGGHDVKLYRGQFRYQR